MGQFDYLQQILGTGGKNTVFTVHKHSITGALHVYYGCDLFDVVPDDREDMRYKLMVAHLYNAKALLTDLQSAFNVDPRTIKRWSNALKSGDAETITEVFAGQKGGRKLTNQLKTEFNQVDSDGSPECNEANYQPDQTDQPDAENQSENDAPEPVTDHPSPSDETTASCENPKPVGESAPNNQKQCAGISPPQWSFHPGGFIFAQSLISLRHWVEEEFAQCTCQWSTQTLLGAANLEQSKLLNGTDLNRIFGGKDLGSRTAQRERLGDLAKQSELAQNILRWNYDQLEGEDLTDFYYDPHTKHYTGKQNVLKGWCSKLRWADKILIGDYIHTTKGQPVYLENCDNYEDMRTRFIGLEERFRSTFQIADDRVLTWVVDRGIYGKDVFEWITGQPNKHIITWEKDYKRDGWPEEELASGKFKIERFRNHSNDLRTYRFEWFEAEKGTFHKGLRRIIVRATNPNENTIEVSILCDDLDRSPREIIWLMFDRWVQENDFKYMNSHFGINQITSNSILYV